MSLSTFILSIFCIWALLLVLKQLDRKGRLRRFVMQCMRILLPTWSLFTYDLRQLDMYMYVRDFCDDGSTTAWRDVTPVGRDGRMVLTFSVRRLVTAFVLRAKAITSSMPLDSPFVSDIDDTRSVMASSNYRTLLHYARSHPAHAHAERRQFLLAARSHPRFDGVDMRPVPGFDEADRVPRLVTGFHALGPETPRTLMNRATSVLSRRPRRPGSSDVASSIPQGELGSHAHVESVPAGR